MKIYKIAIILGIFLLPVLVNAQQNKTQEQVNNVITQITESGITFTVPNLNLDSISIASIEEVLEQEIAKQLNKTEQSEQAAKEYNCSNNLCRRIEADDIVCDGTYMYALTVRDAYDDDYGMYYYSEWKITQYLVSTGKVVAETDFREGRGQFSSFKELAEQKDFGPVQRCELAQLAFQAMGQEETQKQEEN